MIRSTFIHACGGALLSLLLAWQAGARVLDQDSALALRGGQQQACTPETCGVLACGTECTTGTGDCMADGSFGRCGGGTDPVCDTHRLKCLGCVG